MGIELKGAGSNGSFASLMRQLRSEIVTPSAKVRADLLRETKVVDAAQNEKTFKNERDPKTSEPWLTLDDENQSYAAWKRRNWRGKKMLVWNGRLRNSLRFNSAAGRIARWRNDRIELGTADPNAIKHQKGEDYGGLVPKFLKENKRHFPGGRRYSVVVTKTGATYRRKLKGRNWFTLWTRQLPARPIVGKDPLQAADLRGAAARVLAFRFARIAKSRGVRVSAAKLIGTGAVGRLRRPS